MKFVFDHESANCPGSKTEYQAQAQACEEEIAQPNHFMVQTNNQRFDACEEGHAFPLTVIAHLEKENSLAHEGGKKYTRHKQQHQQQRQAEQLKQRKQSATGITVSVQAICRQGVSA